MSKGIEFALSERADRIGEDPKDIDATPHARVPTCSRCPIYCDIKPKMQARVPLIVFGIDFVVFNMLANMYAMHTLCDLRLRTSTPASIASEVFSKRMRHENIGKVHATQPQTKQSLLRVTRNTVHRASPLQQNFRVKCMADMNIISSAD